MSCAFSSRARPLVPEWWTRTGLSIWLGVCGAALAAHCTLVSTQCEAGDVACNPGVALLRPSSGPAALSCEHLEPTGNVITVTSLGDTIAADGVVTLREALTAANTDAPSGDAPAGSGTDAIDLRSLAGTITLATSLSITSSVSVLGPCPIALTISGNNSVRILDVSGGGTVLLGNLNLTMGRATGQQGGDGINNQSGGGGAAGQGGAIFLSSSTLTLQTIAGSNSEAEGGRGGNGGALVGGALAAGANGGGAFFGAGGAGGTAPANGSAGSPGGYASGGGAGGTSSCCGGGQGGAGGAGGLYGGGGGGGGSRSAGNGLGAGTGGTFAGDGGNGCSSGVAGGGGGAGLGGFLFLRSGSLVVRNSQFTNNRASAGAAGTGSFGCGDNGLPGQGKGGAFFVEPGFTFTRENVTFSGNSAPNAAGSSTDNADVYAP